MTIVTTLSFCLAVVCSFLFGRSAVISTQRNIRNKKLEAEVKKLNIDYPPIEQVAIRYNLEEDELESLYGFMDDDLFSVVILMIEKLIANKHQIIESI